MKGLGIPQKDLEGVAGEKVVQVSLIRLLLLWTEPRLAAILTYQCFQHESAWTYSCVLMYHHMQVLDPEQQKNSVLIVQFLISVKV